MAALLTLGAFPGRSDPPSSGVRLESLTRAYLGVAYRRDPLGEESGPDRDPLYRRDAVDCQTFVEQVLAEYLSPDHPPARADLVRIRYRDATVAFNSRRHFCVPDWFAPDFPAHEITSAVGLAATRTLRRTLTPRKYLPGLDAAAYPVSVRTVTVKYLPSTLAHSWAPQIPSGTIVMLLGDRPGIVISHMGWAFQTPAGCMLRHASDRRGRVVDEPLERFLRSHRRMIGAVLMRAGKSAR